jgi:hypothetical protein
MKTPQTIFILLIIACLTGCQTSTSNMIYEDSEFRLSQLEEKNVLVTPAQIIDDQLSNQIELSFGKKTASYDTRYLDVETQNLIAENFRMYDMFTVKTIDKNYLIENNNGTQIVIPIIKKGDSYKAQLTPGYSVNQAVAGNADFLFVPLSLSLNAVSNVNRHYKNEDLKDPGIRADLSYVIYDVKKNRIALSGDVSGVVEKSGVIDNMMGRDAILLAVNKAAENLLKEFRSE